MSRIPEDRLKRLQDAANAALREAKENLERERAASKPSLRERVRDAFERAWEAFKQEHSDMWEGRGRYSEYAPTTLRTMAMSILGLVEMVAIGFLALAFLGGASGRFL